MSEAPPAPLLSFPLLRGGWLADSAMWCPAAGLVTAYRGELGDVAVLTPYQAQLALLRRTFRARGGSRAVEGVEFATVDGFQGREADVVIFSCVRCSLTFVGEGLRGSEFQPNLGCQRRQGLSWGRCVTYGLGGFVSCTGRNALKRAELPAASEVEGPCTVCLHGDG